MSVAVIIPAYNAAPYLAATIESVLAQTSPSSQILVVDDGSKDATAEIAAKYGEAVWCLRQENSGVSVARNHGASQVSTDWLLFLDADDLLVPDALAKLTARAQENAFGVVYGQSVYFTESTGARRLHGKGNAEGAVPAASVANFWKSVAATPGAAIVRRDIFERAGGFHREFNTAADRDFWLRAGMLAPFGFVESPVIEKREHDSNMSGDKSRARRQAAEVQFSFLAWCVEKKLPFPTVTEREILDRNLERALAERAFAAVEWLCAEADKRGVAGPMVDRARRLLGTPSLLREVELRVRSYLSR